MRSRFQLHAPLTAVLLVMLALPLHARAVREDMLVSPEWLQRRLARVTVLDIGEPAEYEAGHIPGAVLVAKSSLLMHRDGKPNELPPTDVLEQVFRDAGVGMRERVVVYSRNPLLAARAWFTLDVLGHGSRAAVLDGGLAKWVASGHPVSKEPVQPRPGSFQARPATRVVTDLATIRRLVSLRDHLAPLVLIDARPVAEFSGVEAGLDVKHPGHIPGAANVPHASNLDADGALRPVSELRLLYQQAGVTRDSANIAYCRTGMQASMTYFVLEYLGYDAYLYDGSFIEWSNSGEMISVGTARTGATGADAPVPVP